MPDHQNPTPAKVVELLRDMRTCMLTTMTSDGDLHSRPMAVQRVDDDATLWFFVDRTSRKTTEVGVDPRVNAGFASGSTWVSVAGTGAVVDDAALKDELWNTFVEAWFPDGRTDPQVTFLRVDSSCAEYWDSPGGRLASVISLVRSKATGRPLEGDHEATDLGPAPH